MEGKGREGKGEREGRREGEGMVVSKQLAALQISK